MDKVFSLPLAAEKESRVAFWGIGVLGFLFCTWLAVTESSIFLLLSGLMLTLVLGCGGSLLARLDIAPEGISITLFGMRLRHIPAGSICLLGGVRSYSKYNNTFDKIAVCTESVEKLSDRWKRYTPKALRNSRERHYGENAGRYLSRRMDSLTGELNLQKRILWLDWSRERLKILREMYPEAQWLDTTDKKIFDTQMESK